MPANLGSFPWLRWVAERPNSPALVHAQLGQTPHTLSWGDLALRTWDLVEHLTRSGLRPGDRWAHASGNTLAGVLAMLASYSIGVVEVPLAPSWSADDRRRLSDRVEARFVDVPDWTAASAERAPGSHSIAAVQRLAEISSLAEAAGPDAPSLILFTSGSSGMARPVSLSRINLLSNAAAKLQAVPQAADDLRLGVLPIWHAYARTCDLGTWLLSGCVMAIGLGWESWQALAPKLRPTLVNTVPSLALRMLDEPEGTSQWSRLRLVGCGGAALSTAAFERFRRRGVVVIQGYGLTETSPVICSATPENSRAGYVGTPVQGWETRIDCRGRLSVRGPGVMLGYLGDLPEFPAPNPEGWFDTGDLVEVDPMDGQYRIIGRADERITLSNGRTLDPGPIERRVQTLDGIQHAVVISDDRRFVLWIDVISPALNSQPWLSRVRSVLSDFPPWLLPREVRVMPVPLNSLPGLLTSKGTIVRSKVLAHISDYWNPQVDSDR